MSVVALIQISQLSPHVWSCFYFLCCFFQHYHSAYLSSRSLSVYEGICSGVCCKGFQINLFRSGFISGKLRKWRNLACESLNQQRSHVHTYKITQFCSHIEMYHIWYSIQKDTGICSKGPRLDPLLPSHYVYFYQPEPWSCSRSLSSPSCAGPWLMSLWSATVRPTWITRLSCRQTSVCRRHTTASTGISRHLSLQL